MGGRLYDEEKGGIVTLNVGGQNFATSEATLLRVSLFLRADLPC